jgi:asparagine synthase (glutamine-hydrolysing)
VCGIVGGVWIRPKEIERGIAALVHRGPDVQAFRSFGDVTLGHTRLSILDLDPRSNQPFQYGNVVLSFNGEIWNYKEIRAELEAVGKTFATTGDTEVVAAALEAWGPSALERLNGMFAMAWTADGTTLHLARDRFGEVPLHYTPTRPFRFASEVKALHALGASPAAVTDVGPGERLEVSAKGIRRVHWYDPPARPAVITPASARAKLRHLIEQGSRERAISDVPVCTLLSGGIDSAAVAYFLAREIPGLVAYTAVLDPKSQDLRAAREVARAIGIELREVRVRPPTSDDLARVVRAIELPHKAQVEIGWACLRLAEVMRADGFKVTFSGEGSDELWGSYGFAYHALKTQDWHTYRKNLFLTQARKNFPRCNKVFMAHSVECRLPFLHPPLVEFALSLPQRVVQDGKTRPKAVIQDAMAGLLPARVTQRAKVAFQDGMGLKTAIEKTLPDPRAFYAAEYRRAFGRQHASPA